MKSTAVAFLRFGHSMEDGSGFQDRSSNTWARIAMAIGGL